MQQMRVENPSRYFSIKRHHNHLRRNRVREQADGTITPQVIEELLKIATHCGYCHNLLTENVTIDHVIPLIHGGKHSVENIVLCCELCNLSKGTKLLTQWSPLYLYKSEQALQGARGLM